MQLGLYSTISLPLLLSSHQWHSEGGLGNWIHSKFSVHCMVRDSSHIPPLPKILCIQCGILSWWNEVSPSSSIINSPLIKSSSLQFPQSGVKFLKSSAAPSLETAPAKLILFFVFYYRIKMKYNLRTVPYISN